MPGADQSIPVDVYIPGCPPRPEQVLDGLMLLQDKIQDAATASCSARSAASTTQLALNDAKANKLKVIAMSRRGAHAPRNCSAPPSSSTHRYRGDDTLVVDPARMVDVMRTCATTPSWRWTCSSISPRRLLGREPRFEVVYHLRSMQAGARLRLKAPSPSRRTAATRRSTRWSPLWAGANWFEREVWDLYGISFRGHPDLRRILMYAEFVGHPLRKDYPGERQPLVRRDPNEV